MKQITIYADGACKGNPGKGGWGVLLEYQEHRKELYGGTKGETTTNNIMELTAVIKGLAALSESCTVNIFTDSKYVVDGMTSWIKGWKSKGWKTATKAPVKNMELWKQLDDLCNFHNVTFTWVKGHDTNPGNNRADELANLGVLL
jgi:ribonuclease HI